jgi:bifunctional polynucleotide phosphatase/kinase
LKESFFVGDAGGRIAVPGQGSNGGPALSKDFSCSDRNLAENLGIRYFCPEEYFLDEKPRTFIRDFDLANHAYDPEAGENPVFEKGKGQEIVLFCGPPGAGKSTFYWKILKPLGYERVNQDILKSRERCVKVAVDLLGEDKSIAVGECGYQIVDPIMDTSLQDSLADHWTRQYQCRPRHASSLDRSGPKSQYSYSVCLVQDAVGCV